MRRGLFFSVALAVFAVAPASPRAAEGDGKKTRIAVLDVQYAGVGDRKTVEGLSALLASEVARRPELVVIAGSDLRALLGFERQKQLLGCSADASCIAELAGALGVAYLVSSEASKLGNTWLLSLALLDAKKAVAVNRLTRKAYTDDALVEEASRGVDELLGAMPALAPVPARATMAIPTVPPPSPQGVAPSGGVEPGSHRHDGFMLRLQLGGGAMSSSSSQAVAFDQFGTPLVGNGKFSGGSGYFGVAVGYAVVPNLIVLGETWAIADTSPTFTFEGQKLDTSGLSHTLSGYGVGAAYYLEGLNAFVEATLGIAKASLDDGNTSSSTENGATFRLGVGKEWWVSTNWGIGAAFNALFGSMKASGGGTAAPTWKSNAFVLVVSATYN